MNDMASSIAADLARASKHTTSPGHDVYYSLVKLHRLPCNQFEKGNAASSDMVNNLVSYTIFTRYSYKKIFEKLVQGHNDQILKISLMVIAIQKSITSFHLRVNETLIAKGHARPSSSESMVQCDSNFATFGLRYIEQAPRKLNLCMNFMRTLLY